MAIKKAKRTQTKLRLGLAGRSGEGKTYTSLQIARELVGVDGKIVVIDLESVGEGIGASEIYDHFNHDVLVMSPDFRPSKITEAINEAVAFGADAIVIDSMSLVWNGPGGALEQVDKLEANSRNSGWRAMTPEINDMMQAIVRAPCHIICTFRVETKVEISKGENGKTVIEKIPEKLIQRKDTEYEFSVFATIWDNNIRVDKTRYDEIPEKGVFPRNSSDFTNLLKAALDTGIVPPATKFGFMAELARRGFKSREQQAALAKDVNFGTWSVERHAEMLAMVDEFLKKEKSDAG